MAIHVLWDDEAHTILRYAYEGAWTWEEAYAAINQAKELMAAGEHMVDCIVDMRASSSLPIGNSIIQIRRMGEMGQDMKNYSGLTVLVQADAFLKALLQVYERVYPDEARRLTLPHVYSLETAHQFIMEQRKLTT